MIARTLCGSFRVMGRALVWALFFASAVGHAHARLPAIDFDRGVDVRALVAPMIGEEPSRRREDSRTFQLRMEAALERAAVLTNLRFCARIANGEEVSDGVDDEVWKGGCGSIVERARALGIDDETIIRTARSAIENGGSRERDGGDAFEREVEAGVERAAVLTELRFCARMANGEEVSDGVDGLLWRGFGCPSIVERASALGISEEEIAEAVARAVRGSQEEPARR